VKLADWLLQNKMNVTSLSRAMGLNKDTLRFALNGRNDFTEDLLSRICQYTNWEVTPNDVLMSKWAGEYGGDGGGDGATPDPDAVPVGGHRGGPPKGAGALSGALYGLAAQVEAHGL
jgi:hypothetical protein